MDNNCIPNKLFVNRSINVLVHMAILFLILGIAFMFYISGAMRKLINEELAHIFEEKIKKKLESEERTLEESINQEDLDRIIKYYELEDRTIKMNNDWLFSTIILANALFIIGVIFMIIIAQQLCSGVNVKEILVENSIILGILAIVELSFFRFIALKHVSVPPSMILKNFVDNMRK